jgi:hypothetical protein
MYIVTWLCASFHLRFALQHIHEICQILTKNWLKYPKLNITKALLQVTYERSWFSLCTAGTKGTHILLFFFSF